jgi:hypothetical protein
VFIAESIKYWDRPLAMQELQIAMDKMLWPEYSEGDAESPRVRAEKAKVKSQKLVY